MSEISNITPAASARVHGTTVSSGSVTGEVKQPAPVADVKTVDTSALQHESAQQLSLDAVKEVASKGNAMLQAANRSLSFQIDDTTKRVVVKIVDSKTGELVRQIPTVEMLDFMRRMKELEGNSGSLLQTKA